ncbi:MAG: hypothetical protein PHY45_12630 [Rhodocyclaceae bacterium]|nr:hypothetical protein [Rhodocyclaceae bacterium]
MNEALPRCGKCFALGAEIEQFSFAAQGDAFRHYRLLLRHGRLPMLCQSNDAGFRVCDELASSPGRAASARLEVAG